MKLIVGNEIFSDSKMANNTLDYIVESVREVVSLLRGMSPVWRDLVSGKQKFITE